MNGEVVQSSNTSDMIFSVPELIAFLSQGTTLLPGTIILTGTHQLLPDRFLRNFLCATLRSLGVDGSGSGGQELRRVWGSRGSRRGTWRRGTP